MICPTSFPFVAVASPPACSNCLNSFRTCLWSSFSMTIASVDTVPSFGLTGPLLPGVVPGETWPGPERKDLRMVDSALCQTPGKDAGMEPIDLSILPATAQVGPGGGLTIGGVDL